MKKIFISLICFTCVMVTKAQDYTLDVTDLTTGASSVVTNVFINLTAGESFTVDYTLGSFVYSDGFDSDKDSISIRPILRGYVDEGTAEITVSAEGITSNSAQISNTDPTGGNGTTYFSDNEQIKVTENSSTLVTYTNTGTVDVFIRYCLSIANHSETISNTHESIFGHASHQARVFNPILNNSLEMVLPNHISFIDIEVLSLTGELLATGMMTKEQNSLDLSRLEAGSYLIRDVKTNSYNKIILE